MPTEIHNHRDREIGANFAGLSPHENLLSELDRGEQVQEKQIY